MTCNEAHRFPQQIDTGRDAVPRRCAGGMGQRDEIERAPLIPDCETAADDFVEFFERQELGDGEFADRNDQRRSQQIDLVVHPGGTVSDFVRRWNAISARRCFPRKAATDRGEINFCARLFFVQAAKLIEPTEERAAGRPGERFAEDRLFYAGRLADQHHFAENRAAGDRGRHHARATPALK